MEELKPLEPDYSHQFTQTELKDYDFRGWDIRRLPFAVKKAERNGAAPGFTVTGQVECVECKNTVWAVDPKLENVCEACNYYLHRQIHEMRVERAKRNNMKPINPFRESEARSVLFNPFKSED